jgi:hypothetical protein
LAYGKAQVTKILRLEFDIILTFKILKKRKKIGAYVTLLRVFFLV